MKQMASDLERKFELGDVVETIKGAQFWGIIIAFDNDLKSPGCTVLAIQPGFRGTKHVYPLVQLRLKSLTLDQAVEIKHWLHDA